MVIRIAVLMLAFLLNFSAVAGTLSGGEVPAVGPKSVEIVRNGAWSADVSGDETPDMCRSFFGRRMSARFSSVRAV